MKKEKLSEKNLLISAGIPEAARKTLFWKRVLELLSVSSRKRVGVNLSRISLYAKDGGAVIVPDKVLGSGALTKKATIAAVSFSATARKIIENSGGAAITIAEAAAKHPTGKDLTIIK
jgi:large subunit ribosomal protein L18e